MFVFIILNLMVSFLFKTDSPFLAVLSFDFVFYLGLFLLVCNFLLTWFKLKQIPYALRYDLFATGVILIWVYYWPPHFRLGSPLFHYCSLYFAFITAFFSILFITKRDRIDPVALTWLQWLSDSGRFHPLGIMAALAISLAFPSHFILLPSLVTLLVLRFTLARCLNNE